MIKFSPYEPRHEKTCLQGFLPGKTQSGLFAYSINRFSRDVAHMVPCYFESIFIAINSKKMQINQTGIPGILFSLSSLPALRKLSRLLQGDFNLR